MLWGKMRNRAIPDEICQLLQYWYGSQTNQVKWDGTHSAPYGLECEVRHRSDVSQAVKPLRVHGLIAELRGMRVGCCIVVATDTIHLFSDNTVHIINKINRVSERKLTATVSITIVGL